MTGRSAAFSSGDRRKGVVWPLPAQETAAPSAERLWRLRPLSHSPSVGARTARLASGDYGNMGPVFFARPDQSAAEFLAALTGPGFAASKQEIASFLSKPTFSIWSSFCRN